MSLCASPEALESLLAGALAAEAEEELRAHVTGCPHCQDALDRLTDHAELRQWAAAAAGVTPLPPDTPPLTGLLDGLRGGPHPGAPGGGAGRPGETQEFVGPPGRVGELGTLGPYRLLAELGRGGMGIVLKAYDPALARTVAVKVLRPERSDARARARFVREARAAAGLDHDHVVPVYAVESPADGPPYLVMPYVPGPTLREHVRARRRLDPREAARVCAEVADGLAAAHAAGLVHRDIKPANVILDADHGRARIVDFGLARAGEAPGDTTRDGAIAGTPEYMSPEQIHEPDRIDARSDVYNLGATLYEALTGEVPFRGAPHIVLQQVLYDDPVPPRRLRDDVPRDLETVCLKAMAKDPARRYQAAAELRDDLRRWLGGEPVRARPVGRVERAWRRARRRPLVASLSAAVVLAVLVGIGGVLWQWGRAEERRELAQKRLGQIESANDILSSIFRDLDPWEEEKGGPALRVQLGERLNQAAAQLEGEAVGDPLTVARLQLALGSSQRGLGYPHQAVALLEKARQTFQDHLGPDDPETLNSMHNLARAYEAAGQSDLALPLYEETLAKRTATLGPDHVDTLHSMNNVANAYWAAGRLDRAVPLYEQTLAKREALLGLDHADTIKSVNNLANAYKDAGRVDHARQLHEQTLAKMQAKLGPDHPHTLVSMNNLADALRVAGRIDQALPLYERTLAKRGEVFGPDHPHTLTSMNNLAMGYRAAGQLDRALPLFEQTLAKRVEKLGPDHPHTLVTMNNLATAYQAAGRLDRALPLLEEVLAKMRVKPGPDHPHTLAGMSNLALAYQAAGRLDQAVPLLEVAVEKLKGRLGPDHPNTLKGIINLALAYQAAGRLDRAVPLLEQALAKQRDKLGPDHPDTLTGMNFLARAYREAGKLDQALSLFGEALGRRTAKLGPGHPDTLLSLGDLGVAHLAAQHPDQGLPLLREFVVRQRKRLGPDHPRLAAALASVGENLLKYGEHAEAETVLRECLDIRRTKQPGDWSTFDAQSLLGGSLLGQKKYAEAEPLLVRGYAGMKQREVEMAATPKGRLAAALERVVRLYEATGEAEQAAAWRKKSEEGTTHKRPE
jgi:tetratricopeptide (TPR) repeat protein/tRNA A-37 threonylcarbamoyl transferase component Bud32